MKPDCANCSKESVYNAPPVPFVVHENMRAQMDAHARRLVRLIVLLVVLIFASNGAWLWYESGFKDEEVTVRQVNDNGYNNYIGNDGDITNGVPGDNRQETHTEKVDTQTCSGNAQAAYHHHAHEQHAHHEAVPDVRRYRQSQSVIYRNSDVVRIVNEYIHSARDREIICDRLVNGLTIEKLAEKYQRSPRAMQRKVANLQRMVFLHMK